MSNSSLKNKLESIIFSSKVPISLKSLCNFFSNICNKNELMSALQDLENDYLNSSLELKLLSSGYCFRIREEFSETVTNFYPEKPIKYSRAFMETLALIVYKQPITRSEIEEVRGVSVSPGIIKSLMELEWVKIIGSKDVPGRPNLYGTTKIFLDSHNLKSLAELPRLPESQEMSSEIVSDQMNLESLNEEDSKKAEETDCIH